MILASLLVGALALGCGATQGPSLLLPAAKADQSVALVHDGRHLRVDGVVTAIRDDHATAHRIDDQRFLIVESTGAAAVYDRAARTVTPLEGTLAWKAGDRLVLFHGYDICELERDTPKLRVIDRPQNSSRLLGVDGARVVLLSGDSIRIVEPGQKPRLLPLPTGFQPSATREPMRGSRLLLVGPTPKLDAKLNWDQQGDYEEPVPYSVPIAVLDIDSGKVVQLGSGAGQWRAMVLNCCSGYRPAHSIDWVSASNAQRKLHAAPAHPQSRRSAVVDEWNELITFDDERITFDDETRLGDWL